MWYTSSLNHYTHIADVLHKLTDKYGVLTMSDIISGIIECFKDV